MCIAALVKGGTVLPKKTLEIMAFNNPDGQGFCGVNTDNLGRRKLVTYKSMDFEKFYEKYSRFQENNPDSPTLVHMRIGTSGTLSSFNCHPFSVNKDLAFIHNGVISSANKDPKGKMNDTQMMNKDILKKLPASFTSNEGIMGLLSKFIGTSKLIFLDVDGNYTFANESAGKWTPEEDVWYSNTSHAKKKCAYVPQVSTRGVYRPKPYTPPTPVYINRTSVLSCDYCGDDGEVGNMSTYDTFGVKEVYCSKCEDLLISHGVLTVLDRIETKEFIAGYNTYGTPASRAW